MVREIVTSPGLRPGLRRIIKAGSRRRYHCRPPATLPRGVVWARLESRSSRPSCPPAGWTTVDRGPQSGALDFCSGMVGTSPAAHWCAKALVLPQDTCRLRFPTTPHEHSLRREPTLLVPKTPGPSSPRQAPVVAEGGRVDPPTPGSMRVGSPGPHRRPYFPSSTTRHPRPVRGRFR